MRQWLIFCLLLLAGCDSGAVIYAPTPAPIDTSAQVWQHPSGLFSVTLPRHWTVHTQYTATLVSAAFTAPSEASPALRVAVIALANDLPIDELLTQYQTRVRPDAPRYTEQNRTAMGDGSWRISGVRQTIGGVTEPLNTFIQREGTLVIVIETVLPLDGNPTRLSDLQAAVNSVTINPAATLTPSDLSTLSVATSADVEIVRVTSWITPQNVLFITGEIANTGATPLSNIPIRAVLSGDSGDIAEAVDLAMGIALPPGGFAPFSLRFGQGQPADAAGYRVEIGVPQAAAGVIYGAEQLTWTDSFSFTGDGQLVIEGSISNLSDVTVRNIQAVATVFNDVGQVIAAKFVAAEQNTLAPNAATTYRMVIPDLGGTPVNYIVNVQGTE